MAVFCSSLCSRLPTFSFFRFLFTGIYKWFIFWFVNEEATLYICSTEGGIIVGRGDVNHAVNTDGNFKVLLEV